MNIVLFKFHNFYKKVSPSLNQSLKKAGLPSNYIQIKIDEYVRSC